MSTQVDRMINDGFRIIHKRVRLFAIQHSYCPADADDMASTACEKAFAYFCGLTDKIELTTDNVSQFLRKAQARASAAIITIRIDQYRRRETDRQYRESCPEELHVGQWTGGGSQPPSPDQRIIVQQMLAEVMKHSTSRDQKTLAKELKRHVDRDDLGLSPAELARAAEVSANSRHGWARKLKTKGLN